MKNVGLDDNFSEYSEKVFYIRFICNDDYLGLLLMKRYKLTSYDNASPATREVYNDFMRTTGSTTVPIWLQSLGHSSALAHAYWERAKGTLFAGYLPLSLKEMIVFVVSARNGARYCSACHAQNVLSLDKRLSFVDLHDFLHSEEGGCLPTYYSAVVAFAEKVAIDANGVSDEDFELLMDAGFTREEVCEIIAVIDMATMFNVYTSTLQLDLDPQYEAIL
ncbi:carboxymuconolactone decarboxylase family protein [Nitrincola schmidtii]|uniref:carboxymuconolactone decarboxylase family protein n=1 Tax=Nitrincola schmidtii TaxID=1730894 RepID=UPI00124DC4A4|nr:carboxymuconolactone decarboxylase family protein [Nitrincola schmidtii]